MPSQTKTKNPFALQQKSLEALARRNRLRKLSLQRGLDFASNDYLGLAASDILTKAAERAIARGVPIGSTGSRLLRGNHEEHEALEYEAARHFHSEACLFVAGGFTANHAIFSTLPQRGDLIIFDELIHASVHEGMRASRAQSAAVPHNDAHAFADTITDWRARGGTGTPWIAVETLYSMDGDRAPISDLATIADRHDAILVVDEAHATGVFGPDGRGLATKLEGRENVISLHTCGKALGVMGGLICAPKTTIDFLINRSRSVIYATAPSPLIAAVVRESLKFVAQNEPLRNELHDLISIANNALEKHRANTNSHSQIIPVIVGTDDRALTLSRAMQEHGIDIRAIRPPTVPEGTARLRIAITRNVNEANISDMATTLAIELERLS